MKLRCFLLVLAALAGCAPPAPPPTKQAETLGTIERLDAALDSIVPPTARIERLAQGFQFVEGPYYSRQGYLLFSDVQGNVIRKWTPQGGVVEFRRAAGYDGKDAPADAFIGPNGITIDPKGGLVICEHGNRRISRIDQAGKVTTLIDKYQGKRLNSPNDVVFKSDGSMYFTDPPYGLPKGDDDPAKELKFNGVYRLDTRGKLTLLNSEMTRPNGLAFSPGENFLYVANSDAARKVWMKFEVKPDGTLGQGTVFADVTAETADGLPDGMKVDQKGNVYGTGPGGVWIFSPEGKHLGTIKPPEVPANVAWGKAAETDAQAAMTATEPATALYMTARTGLYRIELSIPGIRP